ncbi:hypothetical protein [Stakelama pacifica]|uniref:Uncharacterized protein n=1 Tax=Stakelama pacifica TaxID=517720 RepID=A0A4V3BU35_9SPHN|nr:hypothetical protein [Stakelama pacifica]TDN85838.1 hypothetical protein EV664_102549 [Stakelama pacifica]GGO91477.1 hypothetical protein GCM10011329_06220 [Stakelama pacifica]
MKRTEAEPAIRHLTHQWAKVAGVAVGSAEQPSFSDFKRWADEQGYSSYFSFRSTMGALEDAERWFDEELRQTWRN